jgi:hypothetical protein
MKLQLANLATIAFLGLPVSALAAESSVAAPTTAAVAAELAIELTCDEHQRVRPCREPDGSEGVQCVASSPWAAVLHWLEGHGAADRAGDEVRRVERQVAVERMVAAEVVAEEGVVPAAAPQAAEPAPVARKARPDRPLCRPSTVPQGARTGG